MNCVWNHAGLAVTLYMKCLLSSLILAWVCLTCFSTDFSPLRQTADTSCLQVFRRRQRCGKLPLHSVSHQKNFQSHRDLWDHRIQGIWSFIFPFLSLYIGRTKNRFNLVLTTWGDGIACVPMTWCMWLSIIKQPVSPKPLLTSPKLHSIWLSLLRSMRLWLKTGQEIFPGEQNGRRRNPADDKENWEHREHRMKVAKWGTQSSICHWPAGCFQSPAPSLISCLDPDATCWWHCPEITSLKQILVAAEILASDWVGKVVLNRVRWVL